MPQRGVKIISVVGARPQFIKLAPFSRALKARRSECEEIIVHTGQHYDVEMSQAFFDELEIPTPDVNLEVGSGPHGEQTAAMLQRLERVILEMGPDLVVVFGDTNSTLAGALAATKLRIPVAHVEAGLRSYNRRMAEEINRVVADAVSNVLLCPTETAVSNLRREAVFGEIHLVGDVMVDALRSVLPRALESSRIMDRMGLSNGEYALATVHRAENTDDPSRLQAIFGFLGRWPKRVVLPLHPRTRKMTDEHNLRVGENTTIMQPVGYLDMVQLMAGCCHLLTDSGGIQKEAYLLKKPCVTLRSETEWVETVERGWNRLVDVQDGQHHDEVLSFQPPQDRYDPNLFGDGHAAETIVKVLLRYVGS
jgi:UDP-N-acetylglucosamine 2-epimerase